MRRRSRRAVALLAAACLVVGGCGIRPDGEPRDLAADDVPYGLLDEAPPAPRAPNPTVAGGSADVAVYFVLGDALSPATRSVARPATPGRVVAALLEGPTDPETASGLRSAIDPATRVTVSSPSPELAVVDLSADFVAAPSAEQRLAIAQIVYTVTAIQGVRGVRFRIGGGPVDVPLPDGTSTSEPVSRDAFPSLAPPETPENDPA